MPSLKIIKAGLMTSVQDLGRNGLAYYAIPQSGVMDENAARIALLILNKDENSPLLECTSVAPHLYFNNATQIVITGANFNWILNDELVHRNTILEIKEGDYLRGQFAKDGLRGYIAFRGKLKIKKIYNSYSTYTNAKIGGYQGRLLQKGDLLEWEDVDIGELNNNTFTYPKIPIQQGPEFDHLTKISQKKITENIYQVGVDSNRMGIRLRGEKLKASVYQLENSLPVLPGFIQLPPSGLPIIVLQDGQTTGGYPRIAYVRERFLSSLNQIPLGGKFQFVWERES